MTARKPGPSHDDVLAIIRQGPISSQLLGERLGVNKNMAWSRAKELYDQGLVSLFTIPRTRQKKAQITVWYVPGCGVDLSQYRHPYEPPKPIGPIDKSTGIDREHLAWMAKWSQNAQQREEKRRAMRV
jgi:hypothetical protein